MDVVLILHVYHLTTKITVKLFTIISTYSPWRQKIWEARSAALQPIRLITGRVVLRRDCTDNHSLLEKGNVVRTVDVVLFE